ENCIRSPENFIRLSSHVFGANDEFIECVPKLRAFLSQNLRLFTQFVLHRRYLRFENDWGNALGKAKTVQLNAVCEFSITWSVVGCGRTGKKWAVERQNRSILCDGIGEAILVSDARFQYHSSENEPY